MKNAEMRPTYPSSRINSVLLFAVLVAAGLLGNYYKFSIFLIEQVDDAERL